MRSLAYKLPRTVKVFGKSSDYKNMGGPNSSRWSIGYVRRDVVERCQRLALKDFYKVGVLQLGNRQVAKGSWVEMSLGSLRITLDGTDIERPKCLVRWPRSQGGPLVQRLKIVVPTSRTPAVTRNTEADTSRVNMMNNNAQPA